MTEMPVRPLLMIVVLCAMCAAATARAASDLCTASVVAEDPDAYAIPARVLVEEIARRTGIAWKTDGPAGKNGAVQFRTATADDDLGSEGFRISTDGDKTPQLVVSSTSRRGALFAVGYLLRHLECSRGSVRLTEPINVSRRPQYAIRGHQLGYRAKANSYDAWDPATYDQYIRELAFFGTNSVENIPFQDDSFTPVMPISRPEMNREMSAICDKYDIDYWIWTPADFDLTNPEPRAACIELRSGSSRDLPRPDASLFPARAPGHHPPRDVLPFLADLSVLLAEHHPDAGIWMSLQGFEGDKTDYVFEWLDEHQPAWLGGLVGGPSSPPLPELRARLNRRYQLRDYPDITHVVRCQHPERNLDQVIALTAGREPINPRPLFNADVFAETAPHTDGFTSYSDGCHDDVNKALWSTLGWDPRQEPRSILVEYARCFFGASDADAIADGILALEQNWNGSLRDNDGINATLKHWQKLEADHLELAGNWRWQMLLIRAYYDAYQRERLIAETEWEREANRLLDPHTGRLPTDAIAAALSVLRQAETHPVRPDLRDRLIDLFDEVFESIKFQSSVEKYHAIHPQRACMLDFMDYPLNNRFWLEDEFHKVLTLPTLEMRQQRVTELRTWEQPGEGSFYDDIGHVGRSPHTIYDTGSGRGIGSYWWVDTGMSRRRLSWLVTGSPVALEYDQLDPDSSYTLRFSGYGDLKPRADGEALTPTLYETDENTFKEFPVPQELLADGELRVTFDSVYLEGVNWRRQPRLAEAWLLRQPSAK